MGSWRSMGGLCAVGVWCVGGMGVADVAAWGRRLEWGMISAGRGCGDISTCLRTD